jgi:hypothetical protein
MKRYEVRVSTTMIVEATSEGQATEIATQATRCNGPVGEVFTIKFFDHWASEVRATKQPTPKSE